MKSFKQFLNEMPAKIQSVGDFSGTSNMYHYGDDKIITIGAVKAEKLWEKSRGNFKLIFINDPTNEIQHIAPIGGDKIKNHEIEKIAEFFRKRNQEFKPNDNEITVFYTRNDFQLNPMTAWIMAHRFAHMISSEIEEVIEEIYFVSNMDYIATHSKLDASGEVVTYKSLPYKFATMRSARENKIINLRELYHEFMTQYLMTGKVTLNSLDAVVDTSNIEPKRLEEMQNMIPKLNARMNSKFGELLDSLHGKVFMM